MLKKWLDRQTAMREQAAKDAMRIMLRNSFGGVTIMLHEMRFEGERK